VLGDGARFGLNIHYEIEDAMLGTAGALANLAGYFRDATDVLVVYGDLLFNEDLTAFLARHQTTHADVTMLLHRRATRPQSIVDLDESTGRIIRFRERPDESDATRAVWVNSGCQLLRQDLIERFPAKRPLDLPRDIYMPMASDLALYGVPITGYRIAIDSPERYEQANRDVASGKWLSSAANAVHDPS
jgi:NDP-sugar pyrophosphorylase family protein